jgi:hypothetical protein
MLHLDDVTYPFSTSFGLADTRDNCAKSAQEVYKRLVRHTPSEENLSFETLSILAYDEHNELSEEIFNALVRLFPPNGDKNLSLTDFVKSYDKVYRDVRTFTVAVYKASVLNIAYTRVLDVIFYSLMIIVVLVIFHINVVSTLTVFFSMTLTAAFAFRQSLSKFTLVSITKGILSLLYCAYDHIMP